MWCCGVKSGIDDFKNFLKDNKNYLPISIHDVIKGSLSLTDASRKEHFIKLIEDFDDDLIIKGNINELEQSIINILNNAKDSLTSNKNLKNKYIFISTKKTDENHIKIKILDNGGGIKEDILSRIFEPYFTTKHQSIGTGLGLSMVDKIVRERHQGIIKAYNEEYNYNGENFKGACFVITLNNITI
ncbi:MAG: HAMP domain-containing sensor histidine kinase [Campylobacterota bacterium]|nr:HAMP domain-containing sensor histidine kinase [Campylobacterota bacterium]